MKEVKVKFYNCWDYNRDCEEFEIITFKMPKKLNIDIRNELKILDNCHSILTEYDLEDAEDLAEAFHDYDVAESDLEIAKEVLDDGNYGVIPTRLADFIKEKYPEITWDSFEYDLEINIY